MALNYGQEKFGNAVYILATGRGTIKDRLLDAFIEMAPLDIEEDIPAEYQEEVESMFDKVTTVQDGKKGAYAASIEAMSEDDAVAIAKDIVRFDDVLSDEL